MPQIQALDGSRRILDTVENPRPHPQDGLKGGPPNAWVIRGLFDKHPNAKQAIIINDGIVTSQVTRFQMQFRDFWSSL